MNKKLKIIAVIALVACAFLSLTGCSYKKHSKKYSDMVGDWLLDCTYVDAKPLAKDANTVSFVHFDSNKSGKFTVMTKTPVAGAVANADGEIPYTVSSKETSFTLEVSTGEIKIKTDDSKTTDYTFEVDVAAGNIHLYNKVEQNGTTTVYHYIYRAYLDTEVPESTATTNNTTNNTDTQNTAK